MTLLTPHEVAETTGLCYKTVLRMIQRGELEAVRLGSRLRIAQDELDAWLERSRVTPHRHRLYPELMRRPRHSLVRRSHERGARGAQGRDGLESQVA